MSICEHCGERLTGKRAHARYCDSTCRADASRLRAELSASGGKALRSAASEPHPLAEARAAQEADDLKSRLAALIYQGIIDRLTVAPIHADDLEPLYPVEHRDLCRKLAPAQFGSLASRRYIQKVGERKSRFKSRNAAKSGIYEFTRIGREKLTLTCADGQGKVSGDRGVMVRPPSAVSADQGETPTATSEGGAAGESARLFTMPERRPSALTDPEAA